QRDAEEGPEREAVTAPPGDGTLRVQGLEVADEEHAEVGARRDRLPADAVGVVPPAEVLDMPVEVGVGEQAVELLVEDVAGGLRQLGRGDPEFGLVIGRSAAHAHEASLTGWESVDGGRR